MPDYTLQGINLEREYKQAETPFLNLRSKRELWDKLIDRELAQDIQPELTGNIDPVEYRSPDFEKWMFDHVDVLATAPTNFDIVVLSEGTQAKDKGRDILLWDARTWQELNDGGWWDQAVAEGQVRHGAFITKLVWSAYDSSQEDAKGRYWGKNFELTDCSLLGSAWIGKDREPDTFWYKYDMGVLEASDKIRNSDGKRVTLDKLGKIAWIGEHEAPDKSVWDKSLTILVRDARDPDRTCPVKGCDHQMRKITEYVCRSDVDIKEAEEVCTYDSPFDRCSFFVTGGRVSNARDPNRRLRPLLYPALVEGIWYNYLRTVLATAARRDSGNKLYIDGSEVPPHVELPEGGQAVTYPVPDADGDSLPMYPGKVLAFPSEASPHFAALLEESRLRLMEYAPNKITQGTAFEESTEATASVFLQQAQQARLPYDRLLKARAATTKDIFAAIHHAIRFWDAVSPEGMERQYNNLTSGYEDLVGAEKAKPGEEIWVSARKLEIDFELRLETSAETLPEQAQRWMLAKDQYAAGVADEEDLISAAGYRDVHGQTKKLYKSRLERRMQPLELQFAEQAMIKIASVLTGMDLMGLAMGGMPPQLPAGNPGGAEGVAPQAVTGRAMNAPMVQAPAGSSAVVAGQ